MTTDHEPTQTADPIDPQTADSTEEVFESEPTEPESPETAGNEATPSDTGELQTFELTSESRNWATFAHLSAFVMFLGIPSLIGPLVVWLAKKDDPYVEAQAKEALNFNISMLIYAIAAGISIVLLVGIIALPAVFIAWFVLVVVAAIRSADGEQYRYPFTIRLVS
ncbi:MAG: DUF4870 domain-containing protein [Acidimicrobiia bacterium]|jgi:uncharacterized Tic20 family protein